MGKFAKCCCGCCGEWPTPETIELTAPAGGVEQDWVITSDCCKSKLWLFPSDTTPWNYLCSEPTHTDNRSESVAFDISIRPINYYRINADSQLATVSCSVNKFTGEDECFVEGIKLTCASESHCMTVEKFREIDRKRYLAARWRPDRVTVYLIRTETQCDGDVAPVCKWVVVVKMLVRVQYGHILSVADNYVEGGSNGTCCQCTFEGSDQTFHPYCEELTSFPNQAFVTFTRSKEFDTEPSGPISFAVGDVVDCDPVITACASAVGVDQLTLNSTDTTWDYPYNPPTCGTVPLSGVCYVLIEYNDSCLSYALPVPVSYSGFSFGSDMISGAICGLNPNTASTDCYRVCHGTAIPRFSMDNASRSCRDLTYSHTSTGYIPRSLTITAGTWVVTL